jgi:hypothetical protein
MWARAMKIASQCKSGAGRTRRATRAVIPLTAAGALLVLLVRTAAATAVNFPPRRFDWANNSAGLRLRLGQRAGEATEVDGGSAVGSARATPRNQGRHAGDSASHNQLGVRDASEGNERGRYMRKRD